MSYKVNGDKTLANKPRSEFAQQVQRSGQTCNSLQAEIGTILSANIVKKKCYMMMDTAAE